MGRLDAGDVSGDGKLVARCNYEITSTDGDWQDIVIPLIYVEGVGEPTKMNVIISAADYWTRSSIQAGTTLSADDVDFVYYSTLTSLEVGGVAVPDFAADKYAYNMGIVTALPTAESISAVAKSPRADVQVTVDEAAWQVRIVVTNQGGKDLDGETSHTYTLQYASSEEYAGYLHGRIDYLGNATFQNFNATMRIVDYKDGTCDFVLPNFSYSYYGGDTTENFGDIVVQGATVTTDAAGVRTIEGVLPETLLDSDKEVSVKLNGTIDAEGNVNFNVEMIWDLSWRKNHIDLTFTSDMVGEVLDGYLYIVEGEYEIDEDDYKNPVAEKMPVTLLSASISLPDDILGRPNHTLRLNDVTYRNATADITVANMLEYSYYPQFNFYPEGPVTLPDGSVVYAPYCEVYGGTADGVHYEIEFRMMLLTDPPTREVLFCFTTDPVTAGIDNISDGEVAVYGADGRLVKSAAVDGHAEISVAGGFYVVRASEAVKKVIVK